MVIEAYTDKRHEDVVRLVKEFHEEVLAEWGQRLELNALHQAIEKYKKHSFLLVINGRCEGLLAGMEVRPPYTDQRFFHEIIWFVSKPFRLKGVFLLRQVIKTLKKEGYSAVIMTAVMGNSRSEKLSRLYSGMGFEPFEMHYIKRL